MKGGIKINHVWHEFSLANSVHNIQMLILSETNQILAGELRELFELSDYVLGFFIPSV